eukprot:jgi/Orpsp1_1/1182312/evm.model.c7180000080794.1
MSGIVTTKEKNIFTNESPILMDSQIQIIKNKDVCAKIEKEVDVCLRKENNTKLNKNKKYLEQIERRKLLEEYKRKKQEKKN